MLAATVVALLFVLVVATTWLSSRADASQSRCEAIVEHIHRELEPIPPNRDRATGPSRPPASR